MTSAARRKGSRFELDVVEFLRAHGFPYAERSYGAGRPDDRGDIDGVVGWTIEAKCHKTIALAEFMDEAEAERRNGSRPNAAVIAKRRGKPVGASYVMLTLETFARLLADEIDSEAIR